MSSVQNVHLRINDATTKQPIPVRVRVTTGDGTYIAPFGRSTSFPHGDHEDVGGNLFVERDRWSYIDGWVEIGIPPGEVTVEATKGPEYRPLRETVQLPLGKMAFRFAMERQVDMAAKGWIAGDTRVHDATPHAALLEAAAEGLQIVQLLAYEGSMAGLDGRQHTTQPNLIAFSGQEPCLRRPDGTLVAVNTWNTHPVLGKLGLLHSHRIVFPLTAGGPEANDDWSLDDWCHQCHRKGGLVVWTEPFAGKTHPGGESLAQALLGQIDAYEIDPTGWAALRPWYHLLQAGCTLPLVGASGKCSNRVPVGAMRTYAQVSLEKPWTLGDWIEAVRAGRTFVTSGPLMQFTVDGQGPGSKRQCPEVPRACRLEVQTWTQAPIDRVEVIFNGHVIASGSAGIAEDWMPTGSGWLAARIVQNDRIVAHSSIIEVGVGDEPRPIDRAALAQFAKHLQSTREWVANEGRFSADRRREHLMGVFDQAEVVLRRRES